MKYLRLGVNWRLSLTLIDGAANLAQINVAPRHICPPIYNMYNVYMCHDIANQFRVYNLYLFVCSHHLVWNQVIPIVPNRDLLSAVFISWALASRERESASGESEWLRERRHRSCMYVRTLVVKITVLTNKVTLYQGLLIPHFLIPLRFF